MKKARMTDFGRGMIAVYALAAIFVVIERSTTLADMLQTLCSQRRPRLLTWVVQLRFQRNMVQPGAHWSRYQTHSWSTGQARDQ